jgi:hypothetical protein
LEAAKEKLADCLSALGFKELYRSCNSYVLKELPQDAQRKAEDKWNAYVAEGGLEFQLLVAVESENLKGVKEAIDAGADVNSVFTHATLYGTGARDPGDKSSILLIASGQFNLELMALLLDSGADPNLEYGHRGIENDFVYQSYWKLQQQWDSNGQKIIDVVYGPDIGLLAVDYGYLPDEKLLDSMERRLDRTRDPIMKAKISELHSKLLSVRSQTHQKTVRASEFGFHKDLTVDDLLTNKLPRSSDIKNLQFGMEINMRCIASMAALRNSLNPVKDTKMINNINQSIGNIVLMAAVNYDRLKNDGEPSRGDWNSEELANMFQPLAEDFLAPYLAYYDKLLQRTDRSHEAAKRYEDDMDTCAAVASGYQRAFKSQVGG